MKNLGYALISLLLILSSLSQAKEQGPKGLLPELKIDSTNEDENQKKALQSELLGLYNQY
jgi:hypothetical protein